MIRLVFCDVDGTLLPHGETALSDDVCDALRRLTSRGVTVAIASGRPYSQLQTLFGALAHRLIFICLDGAITLERHCVLHKSALPRQTALTLLAQYSHAAVHGRQTIYRLGNAPVNGRAVASPEEISDDFLKLELFATSVPDNPTAYRVAYREPGLVELVAPNADKGTAARALMNKLGIAPEQAMAFGDGENDAALLAAVGQPYRMRGTLTHTDAAETDSVLATLRRTFSL